jgi:HupE / UreJ protein
LILTASTLRAHVVSVSTGELRVDGPLADFELRVPMYEVAHVAHPEALLDHISFAGAHRMSSACHAEGDSYICNAHYEFTRPVDRVDVDCTLFAVTVPNHVHLLHATEGLNSDEAVFDQSVQRAELRFHPPSRVELLAREMFAGIRHAILSPAGIFLLVLMIAARSAREGVLLGAMFIVGEWLIRPIGPKIPWQFSPRFLECALALTVAYLALEILVIPQAGRRWAVVLILGALHGLYFAGFPSTYLAGAGMFQAVALIVLIAVALKWATPRVRQIGAGVLLGAGLAWFTYRVI